MTPREEWQLPTQRIGRRVLVFDQIDSTNTHAARLARNAAEDGLVLLADVQTAGRGQYGRSWQSPPRTSVLTSVLLFPPEPLRRPALLTAWVAVSVCETLRAGWNLQAKIKWPNDVLVQGRKICGILIECGAEADDTLRVVAGLGLNLNQSADQFVEAGLPQATSLCQWTGGPHDRDEVARLLLTTLDEAYTRLRQGDLATLEDLWKERVGLVGQFVNVDCSRNVYRGRLVEMTWEGLWLQTEDQAEPVCLRPESVRSLTEGRP